MLFFSSKPLAEKYTMGKYYLTLPPPPAPQHLTCSTRVVLGNTGGPVGHGGHPVQRRLPCGGVLSVMGCCNLALSVLGLMRAGSQGALAFVRGSQCLFRNHLLNSLWELLDLKSGGQHFPSCLLQ